MNVEIRKDVRSYKSHSGVRSGIVVPPDKSIFHRLLIIGSMTRSRIIIPISAIEDIPVDVVSTILAMQSLGVPIELSRSEIELQGVGLDGFREPKHQINCGNSGTTARLLLGLLSGQKFSSKLTGDASLSARPMKRLADLLNNILGAEVITSSDGKMPVVINGKVLHPGDIMLPVASAQMKSALLFAGMYVQGRVSVAEPFKSRDHTEKMLSAFGIGIRSENTTTSLDSVRAFTIPDEFTYRLPGDISSAGLLIGAAIIARKNITLSNIGLNPTRKRFLDILSMSGLQFETSNIKGQWNEISGTLEIFGAESIVSKPFNITAEDIPLVIDEIPLLAVLAAFCNGETIISGAGELRNKESDRLSALTKNLTALGSQIQENDDGIVISGNENFIPRGGAIEHFGDHRIAMAMSLLGLRAKEPVTISDASVVSISYPNFFRDLALIVGKERINIS
jgi:3-phosphoshikimate 1-carboxyvinyltransferase